MGRLGPFAVRQKLQNIKHKVKTGSEWPSSKFDTRRFAVLKQGIEISAKHDAMLFDVGWERVGEGGRGWEREWERVGEGGRRRETVGDGGRGWERVGDGGRRWERVGEGVGEGGRGWETVGDGGRGWERVGDGGRRWEREWERVGDGWVEISQSKKGGLGGGG